MVTDVKNVRTAGGKRLWPWVIVIVLAIVLGAMAVIPLPYYIYSPGSAESLQPLITVQGGHKTAKGQFLLTTVYVVYAANVYDFLYGLMLPHHQILPAQEINAGLSNSQYTNVEVYMMQMSHEAAKIAALRYLHKPVAVTTTGVEVISVEQHSAASGLLKPGDIITAVNGVPLHNPNLLFTELQKAKIGQTVALTFLRGATVHHAQIRLVALPPLPGHKRPRPGIGILPAVAQSVRTPVRIRINTGNIDGPSAGLMFTLEVINQLYPYGDLTKGYKIAGTGTMSSNGTVGQIGGAAHKVIAAMNAGANYFFVPADTAPGDTNAAHALAEAKKLHTSMRIIPIRSLDQAIAFLKSLRPKSS